MKTITKFALGLLILTPLFAGSAYAYEEKIDETCKKPQFRDFSLPTYKESDKAEVPPESSFTIWISPWAKPSTIKLTAKGKNLDYSLESNNSFHRVKATIPAEYNGMFVRIDVGAKAELGCGDKNGWLVKVANK